MSSVPDRVNRALTRLNRYLHILRSIEREYDGARPMASIGNRAKNRSIDETMADDRRWTSCWHHVGRIGVFLCVWGAERKCDVKPLQELIRQSNIDFHGLYGCLTRLRRRATYDTALIESGLPLTDPIPAWVPMIVEPDFEGLLGLPEKPLPLTAVPTPPQPPEALLLQEGEWSSPMSKSIMRRRLGNMSDRNFATFTKTHPLQRIGRQLWKIRVDGMDPSNRARIEGRKKT